jgi:hypothetical protein
VSLSDLNNRLPSTSHPFDISRDISTEKSVIETKLLTLAPITK